MEGTGLELFARAIGYPDGVPSGAVSHSFHVDGGIVTASVDGDRLVLVRELAKAGEVDLSVFAGYAAGRLLREEAVLAVDPADDALILWQGVRLPCGEAVLRGLFEVFMTSCDWWLARIEGAAVLSSVPEMVIRP